MHKNDKRKSRFDEFNFTYPLGIAPTAFHRMAHSHGELATVRGIYI